MRSAARSLRLTKANRSDFRSCRYETRLSRKSLFDIRPYVTRLPWGRVRSDGLPLQCGPCVAPDQSGSEIRRPLNTFGDWKTAAEDASATRHARITSAVFRCARGLSPIQGTSRWIRLWKVAVPVGAETHGSGLSSNLARPENVWADLV